MPTLVLTNRPVAELACGYDLRVVNLCRQVNDTLHLVVVQLGDVLEVGSLIDRNAVFRTIDEFHLEPDAPASWRRHLRTEEGSYLPLAYPGHFAEAVELVQRVRRSVGADRMIVFGSDLASLAHATGERRVLFDVCDSVSLTLMRRTALFGGRESLKERVQRLRWQRTEAQLPSWFSRVTTINDADSEQVRRLAGPAATNVHTVPNGVGEQFIRPEATHTPTRGVAFWGNLPFGPNREAVRHFVDRIYLPHLQGRGIEVCIVGRDPEPWLVDLARRDPQVRLTGFVADLPGAVARYAVMINPMRSGSGMKNKVLEAFGLGVAVVSTTLGMEAFPDAQAGTHCLVEDDPAAFAQAVLRLLDDEALRRSLTAGARELLLRRYRWEAIGQQWNALLDSV